jgi:hypothetical protein
MINNFFNLGKFGKKSLFDQCFTNISDKKMNSFLKFYFRYLVIIQFHSIQIRLNSLEHTEYRSYPVSTKEVLERCSTWVGFDLACKFLDQTEKGCHGQMFYPIRTCQL